MIPNVDASHAAPPSNVVVMQLSGGLGNQLFSYASGRGIAHRFDAELRFRRAGSLGSGGRRYGLHHFRTKVQDATLAQRIRIGLSLQQPIQRLARSLPHRVDRKLFAIIQDQCWGYTPELFPENQSMFFRGFWQSERYFAEIKDQIRDEFQFKESPREIDRPLLEKIRSTESVCVHVRRGDLITNPSYATKMVTQGKTYYEQASRILNEEQRSPHYFVFSNDSDWPREHLSLGDAVDYLNESAGQGREDFQDLQLMSECKHFIIANSTFSWWAAWLSSRNGTVIAPQRWFHDRPCPPPDLLPENWRIVG